MASVSNQNGGISGSGFPITRQVANERNYKVLQAKFDELERHSIISEIGMGVAGGVLIACAVSAYILILFSVKPALISFKMTVAWGGVTAVVAVSALTPFAVAGVVNFYSTTKLRKGLSRLDLEDMAREYSIFIGNRVERNMVASKVEEIGTILGFDFENLDLNNGVPKPEYL